MKPIAALNEWSCALASIEATLNKYGNPITQKAIILAYSQFFYKWRNNQEGLLSRIEILYLLELLGYNFSFVLFTPEKDEFLASFTKNIDLNRYWASFVLFHQPTNHCNAITSVNAEGLEVMEPDQKQPSIQAMKFQDIHANRSPEYLLLAV